ncbi:ABC transporter ATP-binding protein [Cellulomonas sp. zg-ZUI22]|nr:ABC transporter ATP-binding protein [Cellulomonas sp. zg-ZUI22]
MGGGLLVVGVGACAARFAAPAPCPSQHVRRPDDQPWRSARAVRRRAVTDCAGEDEASTGRPLTTGTVVGGAPRHVTAAGAGPSAAAEGPLRGGGRPATVFPDAQGAADPQGAPTSCGIGPVLPTPAAVPVPRNESTGSPAIEAEGLRKSFGRTHALDGFDLWVAEGEVHGFLGPNGAGKSTTIRALLGQLRLDGGRARIFGRDCWSDAVEVHRRLAYVPGDVALWNGLSGGECIDILVRLQGGGSARRRRELVERFDLDPTKRTRTYSKGNRQKVALVAALSKEADLLLLDEPTSGLDPLMEEVFQSCVQEVKAEGRTVLLSSHILSEVEALCDRVTIIRAGRAVTSGTLDSLRGSTRTTVLALTARPLGPLDAVPSVTDLHAEQHADGVRTRLRVGPEDLPAAMEVVMAAGLLRITVEPPNLNELFLTAYHSAGAGTAGLHA